MTDHRTSMKTDNTADGLGSRGVTRQRSDVYRVIVTGSRNWENRDAIRSQFDVLRNTVAGDFVVIHGACPTGADLWANEWAIDRKYERRSVSCERFPAMWAEHDSGCSAKCRSRSYCNLAGFRRNSQMVAGGADVVLAFARACIDEKCRRQSVHWSHGAADTVQAAMQEGIPIVSRWVP